MVVVWDGVTLTVPVVVSVMLKESVDASPMIMSAPRLGDKTVTLLRTVRLSRRSRAIVGRRPSRPWSRPGSPVLARRLRPRPVDRRCESQVIIGTPESEVAHRDPTTRRLVSPRDEARIELVKFDGASEEGWSVEQGGRVDGGDDEARAGDPSVDGAGTWERLRQRMSDHHSTQSKDRRRAAQPSRDSVDRPRPASTDSPAYRPFCLPLCLGLCLPLCLFPARDQGPATQSTPVRPVDGIPQTASGRWLGDRPSG